MKMHLPELRQRILKILRSNYSSKDATIITDYLIWAEMSGIKTQGIIKLTGTAPLQHIKPKSKIVVEKNTKLSQRLDAGANPSIISTTVATQSAIKKAKKYGFGIVGVRNTFSSNRAQAYYAAMIAKEDLIGIVCSRSPSSTTGFDSIDPLFGTNPIGFGFPTTEDSIVFDMATSAMTFFGLILAKTRGEKIPPKMAIDAKGNETTDPAEAMQGAILPFDRSYKGAGLSMVIEILAGPLIKGAYIDNKTFKEEWGTVVIAIDPNMMVDITDFKYHCTQLVKKIKASRKKEGIDDIRLPGERAKKSYEQAQISGFVNIDDAIAKELEFM
jgi:LDH2 family malate/lactate/ureidoglycolate dehydrogenase